MPLKECSDSRNIRWIDVVDPSREEMQQIQKEFGFNLHLLEDSLDPAHLPKYDLINDVHFLLIRYYNHTIDQKVAAIKDLTNKIAIFYTDSIVVTIHLYNIHFLHDIKVKQIEAEKIHSTVELVISILWNALDTFDDPVQRLSEQVDFYEAHIFLKQVEPEQLTSLYNIKRRAALCQKLLTLTQEPLNHVKMSPEDDAALDDLKDHYLRIITQYNQVLDDVNNLMNLHTSFSAQKTNEVMKLLTTISVFFLPLTFIVGVYGMNFEYMPELKHRWGYPLILLLMIVIVAAIYFWFKRRKWL